MQSIIHCCSSWALPEVVSLDRCCSPQRKQQLRLWALSLLSLRGGIAAAVGYGNDGHPAASAPTRASSRMGTGRLMAAGTSHKLSWRCNRTSFSVVCPWREPLAAGVVLEVAEGFGQGRDITDSSSSIP